MFPKSVYFIHCLNENLLSLPMTPIINEGLKIGVFKPYSSFF